MIRILALLLLLTACGEEPVYKFALGSCASIKLLNKEAIVVQQYKRLGEKKYKIQYLTGTDTFNTLYIHEYELESCGDKQPKGIR